MKMPSSTIFKNAFQEDENSSVLKKWTIDVIWHPPNLISERGELTVWYDILRYIKRGWDGDEYPGFPFIDWSRDDEGDEWCDVMVLCWWWERGSESDSLVVNRWNRKLHFAGRRCNYVRRNLMKSESRFYHLAQTNVRGSVVVDMCVCVCKGHNEGHVWDMLLMLCIILKVMVKDWWRGHITHTVYFTPWLSTRSLNCIWFVSSFVCASVHFFSLFFHLYNRGCLSVHSVISNKRS